MTTTVHQPAATEQEQAALRDAVAQFLAARSPEASVRQAMETADGFDRSLWAQLSDQLGLSGLVIGAEFGGAGAGFAELAVVLEELGRGLYPGPLLATSVAAWALNASDDVSVKSENLPGIAAGSSLATVANADRSAFTVDPQTDRATGTCEGVLDGQVAKLLVVAVPGDLGEQLYLVESAAPGFSAIPRAAVDQTRRIADIRLIDTPVRRIAGVEVAGTLAAICAVAISCSDLGGAEAAMRDAVAYAKTRTQFGRLIGSFQSIKHHCVDLLLAVESSRAAVQRAVRAIDERDDELAIYASIAKAASSDAYVQAAEVNLHIHGGIGFTWEHSAQLHLKRAKSDNVLFGAPARHRRLLAQQLGLGQAQ